MVFYSSRRRQKKKESNGNSSRDAMTAFRLKVELLVLHVFLSLIFPQRTRLSREKLLREIVSLFPQSRGRNRDCQP